MTTQQQPTPPAVVLSTTQLGLAMLRLSNGDAIDIAGAHTSHAVTTRTREFHFGREELKQMLRVAFERGVTAERARIRRLLGPEEEHEK